MTVLVLLLAGLAPGVIAAADFTAGLDAERVRFEETTLEGPLVLLGMLGDAVEKLDGITITAARIDVTRFEQRGYSMVAGQVNTEPARQGPVETFLDGRLVTTGIGNDVYFAVTPLDSDDAGSATVNLSQAGAQLVGVPRAGFAMRPTTDAFEMLSPSQGPSPQPSIVIEKPCLFMPLERHVVALEGNLFVRLYEVDFNVRAGNSSAVQFDTGRELSPVAGPAVQEVVLRWVEIRLTGADMLLRPGVDQVELYVADLVLSAVGTLTLEGAGGTITMEGKTDIVDAAAVTLSGSQIEGHVSPGAELSDERLLVGSSLSGQLDALTIDGVPAPVPEQRTVVATDQAPWSWLVGVLLVFAVAAAVVVGLRNRRETTESLVLRADEAMERGHNKRSARLAQRALKKDPDDVDALALRTVGLLRIGKAGEAIPAIVATLQANTSPDPTTLRVLLAMAQLDAGDETASVHQLDLALTERPEMAQDPDVLALIRRLGKTHPHLGRWVTDPASYS